MDNRIAWIDWAKVVGITLVVYAHIATGIQREVVFLFHMPMWFIISGYLYKPRAFQKECYRCLTCLLIPYLIYNGLLLIITPPPPQGNDPFWKSFCYVILGNQEMLPRNYRVMWFIVSLVLMRLISSTFPKKMILIAVVMLPCAIILKYCGVFTEESDVLQFCTTMLCYHYFVFGYYLRKKAWLSIFNKLPTKYSYVIISAVIMLLVLIGHYYVGNVNLLRGIMGQNSIIMLIVSYGISFLLIGGFYISFKNVNKWVELLSEGTLLILCTHQTIIIILEQIGIIGEERLLTPFVMTFLIIGVSSFGIMVSYKYLPILIGKGKVYKNERIN